MTTDTVGGVWTYAVDLCRALAPYGVEIALATMGDLPNESQRRQAANLSNVALHVSQFRLEWMPDPWDDVDRAGDWLLQLEGTLRPDVIHLNGYAHAAMEWRAPVLIVAHSCVLTWWAAVKREPLPDQWLTYAARVSHGLRAVAHVVAPSQAMLDALRRQYRRLPETSVIYNGRDYGFAHARTKEPFVLSAGRMWDEAKNLSALAAIAGQLPWPVRVAGDTAPGTIPASNIQFLGRLNEAELAEQMSRAAIYVLPAKYEPFGLSALEAALSGCALALGDIPSLREVWGDAALYLPPDDPCAILDGLSHYINCSEFRREMARRALLRARRYTTRKMAGAYVCLYQHLIGAGKVSEPGLSKELKADVCAS